MREDRPAPYPLRLEPELRARVEASANSRKWPLSTWFKEAIKLMLSVEDASK